MQAIGWWVLATYNALVFLVYAQDKIKARKERRRTPEATLLWLAAAFGGMGALLAIHLIRHKSRKPKFTWGVGLMAATQIALLVWGRLMGWY